MSVLRWFPVHQWVCAGCVPWAVLTVPLSPHRNQLCSPSGRAPGDTQRGLQGHLLLWGCGHLHLCLGAGPGWGHVPVLHLCGWGERHMERGSAAVPRYSSGCATASSACPCHRGQPRLWQGCIHPWGDSSHHCFDLFSAVHVSVQSKSENLQFLK